MAPLVTLFGRETPTYGLLAVLGAVLGLGLALLPRSRRDLSGRRERALLYVWGGIGALLGGKALYLLTTLPGLIRDLHLLEENLPRFAQTYLWSGLVFYGGLAGALGGAALGAKGTKGRLGEALPALLPAFALAHAVGRLGCFCAGCCYGVEAEWGIAFTRSLIAPNGVRLAPVQLMECAVELALCGVLLVLGRRGWTGWRLLGLYLTCYGPARFGLEFLRGDPARGALWGLSTSQWLSVPVLCAGVLLLYFAPGRGRLEKRTNGRGADHGAQGA